MALHTKSIHKAVVVGYDQTAIHGPHVAVIATDSDKQVKDAPNDGDVVVFFPASFTGTSNLTIKGSKDGEQTGTITV